MQHKGIALTIAISLNELDYYTKEIQRNSFANKLDLHWVNILHLTVDWSQPPSLPRAYGRRCHESHGLHTT